MKFFMYIILLILENIIKVVTSEYNVLSDVKYLTVEGMDFTEGDDGYTAYKFSDTSNVNASISDMSLNGVKLSSPFILNVMFKFDRIKYSCLFAITDSKEQLKLRLCLSAADQESFSLFFDSNDNVDKNPGTVVGDPKSWQDLFLVIQKNTIEIYIECIQTETVTLENEIEDIYFSDDSTAYIGQSGTEKRDPFNGAIQKLVIYPETDDVKTICRDEIFIPDSLKVSVKGEKGDKGLPGNKGEKGGKGDKGDKGESVKGSKGDQGQLGPIGPIGSQGPIGAKGDCQCSETMVSALIRAMPETKGPQGNPGPKGNDGVPGRQGEIGPPGQKGDSGVKGEMGQTGIQGKEGPSGLKGEPGKDGNAGSPGLPGLPCKGEQGTKGEKGERGETGLPGLKSEPGVPGTHGKDGKKGDKGETGQKGETGMPAKLSSLLSADMDPVEKAMIIEKLKGYKGDRGDKGDIGAKGDIGISGIPGRDGIKGQTGLEGPIGPRGEKGDVGLTGPKGIKGSPGIVSMSILKSLKGPKGDQGKSGRNGPRGYTGPKGQRGPLGPLGPRGPKGDVGAAGEMGPAGARGERGQKGERGDIPVINLEKLKGEKGERGAEGIPGKPGEAGPPGVCHRDVTSKPVSGPPGSPGARGPPGPLGPSGIPGVSVYGPKGEPGGIIIQKTLYNFGINSVDPDDDDVIYATETLIYKTSRSVIKRTKSTALGTLAYVLEEKLLLLRVEDGWQRVMMGPLLTDGLWAPNNMAPSEEENLNLQRRRRKNSTPPNDDKKLKPKYSVRLIALDKPFSGKMETATNRSGRKTVDHECHVQSQKANITGTFTAFLPNRVEDLKYIPKTLNKDVKVVNIRGETLLDSWSELFKKEGTATVKGHIYSFGLKNVLEDPTWGIKAIWSGSTSLGIRKNDSFCHEWQSDNPNHIGTAINVYDKKVIAEKEYTCDKKLIVLCVEVIGRKKRHISSRWRRSYSHLVEDRIEG